MSIRLLIADDQYLIREGLKHIAAQHGELEVVGEVEDLEELAEAIVRLRPEVVVLDPDSSKFFQSQPLERFEALAQSAPATCFLIISNEQDVGRIRGYLEAGVNSFLTKQCGEDEIVSAIKACTRDDKFFCTKVLDLLIQRRPADADDCAPSSLTSRETEIVRLIATGNTTRDIAMQLNLSPHTVNTHRKNILRKLNVKSGSELVLYAVNAGLIKTSLQL